MLPEINWLLRSPEQGLVKEQREERQMCREEGQMFREEGQMCSF